MSNILYCAGIGSAFDKGGRQIAVAPAVIECTLAEAKKEVAKLHASFSKSIYKVDASKKVEAALAYGLTKGVKSGFLVLEKLT